MAKFKATSPTKPKLVWRISKRAPNGEWVDPTTVVEETPRMQELPEVTSGGWVMSSFDLLNGTDVNEEENTIPGELFDELFAPPPSTPPGKPEK